MTSRLAAIALMVILTGCADMQWAKPGIEPARADGDLSDCRVVARQHVLQQGIVEASAAPVVSGMARDNVAVVPVRPLRENDRFLAEHETARACMVSRGYQLRRK